MCVCHIWAIVVVGHKPLLKLLGDRALDEIPNPRLRNLKEMVHVAGLKNKAADAMSCQPVGSAHPPLMNLPDDQATITSSFSSGTHLDILSQVSPSDTK